jgi:hypothetical protein
MWVRPVRRQKCALLAAPARAWLILPESPIVLVRAYSRKPYFSLDDLTLRFQDTTYLFDGSLYRSD